MSIIDPHFTMPGQDMPPQEFLDIKTQQGQINWLAQAFMGVNEADNLIMNATASATAETLESDQDATAQVSFSDNTFNFEFGIPKGAEYVDPFENVTNRIFIEPEYIGKFEPPSTSLYPGSMTKDDTYVYIATRNGDDSNPTIIKIAYSDFISGDFTIYDSATFSDISSHCNDLSIYGNYLLTSDWLSSESYKTVTIINKNTLEFVKRVTIPTPSQINGFAIAQNNYALGFCNNACERISYYYSTTVGALVPLKRFQDITEAKVYNNYAQGGTTFNNNFYKISTGKHNTSQLDNTCIFCFNHIGEHIGTVYLPKSFTNRYSELQGIFCIDNVAYIITNTGQIFKLSNFPTRQFSISTQNDYYGSFSVTDIINSGLNSSNISVRETIASYNVDSYLITPYSRINSNLTHPTLTATNAKTVYQLTFRQNNDLAFDVIYNGYITTLLYKWASVQGPVNSLTLDKASTKRIKISDGTTTTGTTALNAIDFSLRFLADPGYSAGGVFPITFNFNA